MNDFSQRSELEIRSRNRQKETKRFAASETPGVNFVQFEKSVERPFFSEHYLLSCVFEHFTPSVQRSDLCSPIYTNLYATV